MILLASGLTGCTDNDDFISNQIEFKVLTKENGTEKVAFDEGEDVAFAVIIVNRSDRSFEWRYDYTCGLLQSDDFLLVRRKLTTGNPNETGPPVGQPFQTPVYCPAISLPPQMIVPGETILVEMPWSANPDNPELLPGKYYTEFVIGLTISSEQRSWHLRTEFQIL